MKKLLVGVIAGLCSLTSFASENNISAELLVGRSNLEVNRTNGDGLFLGIRGTNKINENIAIEASYFNYGKPKWTVGSAGGPLNEETSADSLNLGLKGEYSLQNRLSLIARLGVAFWEVDIEIQSLTIPGLRAQRNDSGTDVYYGIGCQYALNDYSSIGIDYILSEFEVNLGGADIDLEFSTLALVGSLSF